MFLTREGQIIVEVVEKGFSGELWLISNNQKKMCCVNLTNRYGLYEKCKKKKHLFHPFKVTLV